MNLFTNFYRNNFLNPIKEVSLVYSTLLNDIYQSKNKNNNFNKDSIIKTFEGVNFRLFKNEEIIEIMGKGAYGIVAMIKNKDNHTFYAIKKIKNVNDSKILTIQILRELRICRLLEHENLIKFENIRIYGDIEKYKEIYLKLPLMEADLNSIIKSKQQLTQEHIKLLMFQIFKGLKYLHEANIIHRDLVF